MEKETEDSINSATEDTETANVESELESSYSDLTSPPIARKLAGDIGDNAESIENTSKVMAKKVSEYLKGELTATCEEYKLLQTLNNMTISKYKEMSSTANHLVKSMEDMNESYKLLIPYLNQIDLLEQSVIKLEETAHKLDTYSKTLEARFKAIDRK